MTSIRQLDPEPEMLENHRELLAERQKDSLGGVDVDSLAVRARCACGCTMDVPVVFWKCKYENER